MGGGYDTWSYYIGCINVTTGELREGENINGDSSNNYFGSELSAGLRPVFSIKDNDSSIKVIGKGTEKNPYKLLKE